MGAPIKALSVWVVRGGLYRQLVGSSPWWQNRAGLVEKPTGVYVKQVNVGLGIDRLVQLFDETPPGVAPSSVSATNAGSGKLGVSWSTTGLHPLWDAVVVFYELEPGPQPGDPDTIVNRGSQTLAASAGYAQSSHTYLIGDKGFASVRFKMNSASGSSTDSNTVTF